jgi:IS30 family transposase
MTTLVICASIAFVVLLVLVCLLVVSGNRLIALSETLASDIAEHGERDAEMAALARKVAEHSETLEREVRRLKRDLARAENYVGPPAIQAWPEIDRRTGNSAPSPLDAIRTS